MTAGVHIQAGVSGTVGSDGSGHSPFSYDEAIDCGFGSSAGADVRFNISPTAVATGNIYLHDTGFSSEVSNGPGYNVHYKVQVTDPFLVPDPDNDAVIGNLMYTHLQSGWSTDVIWPGGKVGELADWQGNTHLHLEWTGHDDGHYFKNRNDLGDPDAHGAATNMGNLQAP